MQELDLLLIDFDRQIRVTGLSVRSWLLRDDGVLVVDLDNAGECPGACDISTEALLQRLERRVIGHVKGIGAVRVSYGLPRRSRVLSG